MELIEALRQRHSVRSYINKPLDDEHIDLLESFIADVNSESGLHIQLVKNEPTAFDSILAHYGLFEGVTNYLAVVGKKSDKLEENAGYYGQKIVLYAQTLGLNTCWVALTCKKVPDAFKIGPNEKLAIIIAIGYGTDNGRERKSKTPDEVSNIDELSPEWFRNGVDAALLAPTAVNQQKFKLVLTEDDTKVKAKAGMGFNTAIDLGIVKYNFEIGSGKDHSIWV